MKFTMHEFLPHIMTVSRFGREKTGIWTIHYLPLILALCVIGNLSACSAKVGGFCFKSITVLLLVKASTRLNWTPLMESNNSNSHSLYGGHN